MTQEEKVQALSECIRESRSIEELAERLDERGLEVKRDTAVWLEGHSTQPCSNCRYRGKRSWKFCPGCGFSMRAEVPR